MKAHELLAAVIQPGGIYGTAMAHAFTPSLRAEFSAIGNQIRAELDANNFPAPALPLATALNSAPDTRKTQAGGGEPFRYFRDPEDGMTWRYKNNRIEMLDEGGWRKSVFCLITELLEYPGVTEITAAEGEPS